MQFNGTMLSKRFRSSLSHLNPLSGSWLSKICVSRKEKLIDANVSLLCVSVCISVTIVRQASGFDRIFS